MTPNSFLWVLRVKTPTKRFVGVHVRCVARSNSRTVLYYDKVKLGRKSTPHRQVVEEFPLRGLVQCSGCGKNLTAGFAKGKMGGKYARYWCWNSRCQCKATAGRDELETRFVALLKMLKPMADILAKLPEIATREWEERKARIAKDAETLSKRRGDQLTMNQKTYASIDRRNNFQAGR